MMACRLVARLNIQRECVLEMRGFVRAAVTLTQTLLLTMTTTTMVRTTCTTCRMAVTSVQCGRMATEQLLAHSAEMPGSLYERELAGAVGGALDYLRVSPHSPLELSIQQLSLIAAGGWGQGP